MKALYALCVISMLLCASGLSARPCYGISASAGLSFITYRDIGNRANYSPIFSDGISFSVMVPVVPRLHAELGIGYERRGFNVDSMYEDKRLRLEWYTKPVRHYATLPLMLMYECYKTPRLSVAWGGGMYYGILVKAKEEIRSYGTDGTRESYYFGTSRPRVGLDSRTASLSSFDVSVKMQLAVVYHAYTAMLYYSRGLGDVNIGQIQKAQQQFFRQHNVGISIGMLMGRRK